LLLIHDLDSKLKSMKICFYKIILIEITEKIEELQKNQPENNDKIFKLHKKALDLSSEKIQSTNQLLQLVFFYP